MNWIFPAVLTIILYTVHDVILKGQSKSVNASLASVLINLSAMVMAVLYYYVQSKSTRLADGKPDSTQIAWLCVAGAALSLATILFMKAFAAHGGDIAVVLPVVYIGIIAISPLVGYFLFKEAVSIKQVLGIVLAGVGIFLIAK